MSTPEAFANRGLNILTQWAQLTDQLDEYAAVFEARGGADGIRAAKYVDDGNLTPEQLAYNDQIEEYALATLDVVTHHNLLMQWYDASIQQRVNIRRTDF